MLTLTEAAARLGVTASTLRHQIANGKLRGRLVGKTWTVSEREIERYRADSLGCPGRRHAPSMSRKSPTVPAKSTPES